MWYQVLGLLCPHKSDLIWSQTKNILFKIKDIIKIINTSHNII